MQLAHLQHAVVWVVHTERWLDFNTFQSGHRRYDQDNEPEKVRTIGGMSRRTSERLRPNRP